jgi:hypothetical protein
MVLLIALTIPIYRTGDATTLDGFPSPANDKDTIWRNPGVKVRFHGENIHGVYMLLVTAKVFAFQVVA